MGSICGDKPKHAFNSPIGPFENLILFDPLPGGQIGYKEYTPYLLCCN